jgi:hypothetical protein
MYALIFMYFFIPGLSQGAVQLPVPRPLCRSVVLRVRSGVGPVQVHVPLPAVHAAGVLVQIRI